MLPKRIAIFGINYAPELTGIAPYTTELAEHFSRRGHSVRVVTGVPHYPQWKRFPIPTANGSNPTVVRHQHFIPRRAHAFGRMLYELSWFATASRTLASGGADAALGMVPSLAGGLLAVMAGRRWNVPTGLVVYDLMGPGASQSGYRGGGAVAGAITVIESAILRRADRVAIISDGFRPYVRAAGVPDSKIQRVRAWTHPGSPTESREACRRRLGWSVSEFVCLHAGNMGQKQGLDTVLDAAKSLRNTSVRVVLAGDGNDRARLGARVQAERIPNVSFVELQRPGSYEAMLQAADVLIVNQRPSVSEMSLPSKLASYFASGRPVVAAVASDSATAREVEAAVAGLVVATGNATALMEGIQMLARSPELACSLGLNAQRYADAFLGSGPALRAYDDFLDDLTRKAPAIRQRAESAR